MKLPPADDAAKFIELRFKPGTWETRGIPEQGCRLRLATLDRLLGEGASYEIDDLIFGLMDWLDVTDDLQPALATLRLLLDRHYPDDGQRWSRCVIRPEEGQDLIFHVASDCDCSGPIVAWQREQWVIALAKAADEEGRMTVSAPGPISLDVAKSILGHSVTSFMLDPHDSFAGAWASGGRTANFYRLYRGRVTTNCWEHGLGIRDQDGELVRDPDYPPITSGLPSRQLAMQVAIAGGYHREVEGLPARRLPRPKAERSRANG